MAGSYINVRFIHKDPLARFFVCARAHHGQMFAPMTATDHKRAWLRQLIRPLAPLGREVLATSLFINLMALATPIFVMQVYDRVIGHAGLETLKGLVIGMMVVLGFDYVLRQARGRIAQMVALRLDVDISHRLFTTMTNLPLRVLEQRSSAHWQQLFRDVDMVRNTLSGATAMLVADLPFMIIFLAVIVIIAQPLAAVYAVILPIFVVLAWHSARSLNRSAQEEKGATIARDTLTAEIVAGRGTIKAVALDRAIRPLWEARQAQAIEHSMRRGCISDGYVNLGSELILAASVVLTTVGALYIIDHQLSMGALIACNMLSGRLYGPINQLVGAWRSVGAFRQSMDRLGEVFSIPQDNRDSAVDHPRPKGVISLEKVVFSYDPASNTPTLSIPALTIEPGGVTAILGKNGSGKTTLLKLIMGLYPPDEGRILLDNADMAQFGRNQLAGWIGYVPQDTALFNASIRDNIAYGSPAADDQAIMAAARAAGVHDVIVDLPGGYGTMLGEAGSRLSAGQRQRISIARALVADPPILVLDEPSASLDRNAEEALRATLAQLATGRTVIMVTHSPVLLPVCRRVIVLDRGQLAAHGPAQEVLPKLMGGAPPRPAPGPGATISTGGAA